MILHHWDCTYCVSRKVFKGKVVKGKKPHEVQFCRLTDLEIPIPWKGQRWCKYYQQTGCICPNCVITVDQLKLTIDKTEAVC